MTLQYDVLQNWDPLQKRGMEEEILSVAQKLEIKNILKSYTGWFDLFCELIQNALDAVDHRTTSPDCPKEYVPQLWITIDLKENCVKLSDNGIGFSFDQYKWFLAPNVTFKGVNSRGNKGVGATYLAYGFNYLQVSTKSPGFIYEGVIENGREWVEDQKGIITRPKLRQLKTEHGIFAKIDRGASFTLKLIGQYIRPKDLSWIGATNATQWSVILRIKTPLGGIYIGQNPPKTICHLEVIDREGNKTEEMIHKCEFIYPDSIFGQCGDLKEIKKARERLAGTHKDPAYVPAKYKKLNGIYNFWSTEDLLKDPSFGHYGAEQRKIISDLKLQLYAFFCFSTSLWDQYNDKEAQLREGMRILHGGLQLATNCMPQGELLTIPLTRNIGYQQTTFCIVHFSNADPDLGRKGFQPELEDLAGDLSRTAVGIFQGYRDLLKKDVGAPLITLDAQRHQWVKEQEEHAAKHPLIIKGKGLFMPTEEVPIRSMPLFEQDVVALFNQLLAAGVIRGIKILSTSEHKLYDGIYVIDMTEPFDRFVYDRDINPLGVPGELFSAGSIISAPQILEYKYSVDALMQEFEKEEKYPTHINLVVAWEMGSEWQKRYEITSLLDLDNIHHRHFHGETHELRQSGAGAHVFYAIILSELVDYLCKPAEEVQKYQKSKYGS
jgi:hypothetical protein